MLFDSLTDVEVLKCWHKLAARASSIEDFQEKIFRKNFKEGIKYFFDMPINDM